MTRTLAAVLATALLATGACAQSVVSPDGRLEVEIGTSRDGQITYQADWRGEPLVEPSAIGIAEPKSLREAWRIEQATTDTLLQQWSPIVGKRRTATNHCNELVVRLLRDKGEPNQLHLIVRAYDDGLAIRCRFPAAQTETAPPAHFREHLHFRFAHDPKLWSYTKEDTPIGPVSLSKAKGKLQTPVLAQLNDGTFAAIHEADLINSGWLQLRASEGVLVIEDEASDRPAGWQSPWRVIQVGETLADLVDSDLLANLNPKADAEEFAWVKPGVAFWDWRSWGYNAPDGFQYGLNFESWQRFIDFAAEHEVPYVLLDANWYGPEFKKESNPFTGGVADDVRRAIDYGKKKNVGLILYLNDVAGNEHGIEEILKTWSEWGAAGIKYGFMKNRSPADKVAWTRRIVTLCAENHLLVNFHDGPIPPAGGEATLPNWATREFCHAQSDARRSFTPSTFLMQMAVNQLAGPIDMNNGMFDLEKSVAERPRVFVEVPATITAEAARTLIVYSGMTVIPDAPPAYERHPELFRFIAAQKMPWTESKTLAFELGESITVMRQTGDTFLVGSSTNEEARTLRIPLDFLPAGKKFSAALCEDAPDAHFRTNREAYGTRAIEVDSTTVVEARLAPGGGHCMLITPLDSAGPQAP